MKTAVSGCSVEEAMRLLGGRWRLLIASYLLEGPKRFNELRREMPDISQRMLTLDLKALQEVGLVKRTAFPTVPVTVQYELTEDGARLAPVVEVMREFGLWVKSRPMPPQAPEPYPLAHENPAGGVVQ
ncbi:HxlR family transcriptional regulator [Cupriavidus necator]|uniref:winged helix-turn-helix transcriptional regulator n=1 Tax=Cupriavidus necator TaxID=106590 RepID=UPI0007353D0A|nr:helix-turn-helix domain-containing protein [Cupriavidus necator]KUE84800.1 HxlR family transcriptional regulator [Cupriavidus necator]